MHDKETNDNLTNAQRQILCCHHRLGHVDIEKLKDFSRQALFVHHAFRPNKLALLLVKWLQEVLLKLLICDLMMKHHVTIINQENLE